MREQLPPRDESLDERFRKLKFLTDHWSRPAGPRAYYWYLSFGMSPQLRFLVKQCQELIAFPYYDLIPESGLHLTLDRVAYEGEVTPAHLRSIEAAATRALQDMAPFEISIGSLGGTSGALGFSASPATAIECVRDVLREATLSVYPNAPIKTSEFSPHVTVAYCNSARIPAAQIIEVVERLNKLPPVNVAVAGSVLVLLERRQRAYTWQEIFRIPCEPRHSWPPP
jgi:2'-5' RNA ligase